MVTEFDQGADDAAADFVTKMREATLCIDDKYINFPIYGEDPVLLERVYCYELYHQIRQKIPAGATYGLMAEVDKRSNPLIYEIAGRKIIPDLIAHVPKSMQDNLAVVEVKRAFGFVGAGVKKDLENLTTFRTMSRHGEKIGYRKAIFLAFGDDKRFVDDVKKKANKWANDSACGKEIQLDLIMFYWHEKAGTPAVCVPWNDASLCP